MNRRDFIAASGMTIAGAAMARGLYAESSPQQRADQDTLTVTVNRDVGSLPHFWEKCFGSDRVAIGLRAEWRDDLVHVQPQTGMQAVRCHGLFDDEMGIAESGAGNWNFLYVDKVYDFMLDHGVRPFVELSFMPEAMASSANRVFMYKGNVSPPRRWNDWSDMVQAFTRHCIDRYGIGEVSNWKFEVWNEPNIAFWAGSQEDYFELYRRSALALKQINKRLSVGGPATAQLSWIPDMIAFCARKSVPIDFVSSHVYAKDPQKHIFGKSNAYPHDEVIPAGVRLAKHQIESSAMPNLPLWITEWSSQNPAFIAHTLNECIGLTEAMSYWTFSNVFEERGLPKDILNQGFGLMAQLGIERPSLHAFEFLHRLGETRLRTGEGPILATRRGDGSLAILIWNLIPNQNPRDSGNGNSMIQENGANGASGLNKTISLKLEGWGGRKSVKVSRINGPVGAALPLWERMGRPQYPSRDQVADLRKASKLPPPQDAVVDNSGGLTITLPPDGVALLELTV